MCLIVVGHAMSNLDTTASPNQEIDWILGFVFDLGTPGFILVSGTLLGYFAAVRADPGPILRKYRGRGLLLFAATHALIAVALYHPMTGGAMAFDAFFAGRWYITDTLAIIFVFVAPLAVGLDTERRMLAGLVLLGMSPFLLMGVYPESRALLAVKELLFGIRGPHHVLQDVYPLVPMTGMFLVGMYFGDRYARALQNGSLRVYLRSLLRLIPVLLGVSAVMVGIWYGYKSHLLGHDPRLQEAFYPNREFSLFGFYLACYLFVFAFWIWRSQLRQARATLVERAFLIMGQTSLFTYVIQYFVVQAIPYTLGLHSRLSLSGYAVLCAVGLVIVYHAAIYWDTVIKRR